MPRVIVTRPQLDGLPAQPDAADEDADWLAQLSAAGLEVCALPLLALRPLPAAQAELEQAWQAVAKAPAQGGYAAVMFVSAAAVAYFFAAKKFTTNTALAQFKSAQSAMVSVAWATGPGTRAALLQAGWPSGQICAPDLLQQPLPEATQNQPASFDSEALWQLVGHSVQAGQRVLIVRGADAQGRPAGRDWLAAQLRAAGVQVDQVAAYQRSAPQWSAAQVQQARAAAQGGSVWLLSSSEGVAHLPALLPGQSWHAARALATHPRIAQAASAVGFGQVQVARPVLQELLATLRVALQDSNSANHS